MKVYNILASGSDGNAHLYLDNKLLVDAGVSYKMLEPYVKDIQYIFISHIHSDHFNKRTLKRIHKTNPFITFLVGTYLKQDLLDLGIKESNIQVVNAGKVYNLNEDIRDENYKLIGRKELCKFNPITLYHNVENMGFRMYFDDKKLFHATDTYTLVGIEAKNFDYYMVERNYCEIVIEERIKEANENNVFTYANDSKENHHSKQALELWLSINNKNNGEVYYLHQSMNNLF